MKKYIKTYLKHNNFDVGDFIPCQICSALAVDIHHIIKRSQGGKDTPDNLIALCRECHTKAHNEQFEIEYLQSLLND